MGDRWQILIASPNLEARQSLVRALTRQDLDPICVSTVAQCAEALGKGNIRLVFCDRFFTDGDYHDVLAVAGCSSERGKVRVVLLSVLDDAGRYENEKRQGLFDVIRIPCRPTDVEWMVIQTQRDEQKRISALLVAAPGNAVGGQRTSRIGTT